MQETNPFKQAIQTYLEDRAKTDELFAKAYTKENKSIDECCAYIMGEAEKRGDAVAIFDAEVFGMAVHYFDEDNIKVNKMAANVKTSVSSSISKPVELAEEDKEAARKAALKRLEEEQYALIRKKAVKPKKEEIEVQQMSLFQP